MHTTRSLSCNVQAGQRLALGHALAQNCSLQTAHAVMDHRRDDGHIEGLSGHSAARDNVVVELLAAASLATGLVPRLARRVGWPRATIRVLLGLLGSLVVLLSLINKRL